MSFVSDFEANVLPDIYATVGDTAQLYRCKAVQIASGGAPAVSVTGEFVLADTFMGEGDRAIDTATPTFEATATDLEAIGVAADTWSLRFDDVSYDVTRYNPQEGGPVVLSLRRI